jgi:Na+-translocating ferredoxin:NAD+ oxidoreductase RNF subunit RnfB
MNEKFDEYWEDEKTPCDTCKYDGLDCLSLIGICNNHDKWKKKKNKKIKVEK